MAIGVDTLMFLMLMDSFTQQILSKHWFIQQRLVDTNSFRNETSEKLSHFRGCTLWRSHLLALYVIKVVSFQKITIIKLTWDSLNDICGQQICSPEGRAFKMRHSYCLYEWVIKSFTQPIWSKTLIYSGTKQVTGFMSELLNCSNW